MTWPPRKAVRLLVFLVTISRSSCHPIGPYLALALACPIAMPPPLPPCIFVNCLQDRVKNIKKPAPAKRTKEELAKDAAKARDAHRKGHGHHQKKARKFADPRSTDEEEQKLAAQLVSRVCHGRPCGSSG